jgi:integrase
MYARTLRIIYNLCADKDPTLRQYYPFGNAKRGKFKVSDSRKGRKKGDALTIDQIKKFISTSPEPGSTMWEAKMYWLFSFYCQGMNFRDICFLSEAEIHGNIIRYTRQKTKRTDNAEVLEIAISAPIEEILEALRKPRTVTSSYIFPIIPEGQTDVLKIEGIVLQKIKTTNKWLKRLCEANDLPAITTYWSRHSYASLLKFSGTPVEVIRELLGHSDLRTTEHYLKRFDLAHMKAINSTLQNLVNPGKEALSLPELKVAKR